MITTIKVKENKRQKYRSDSSSRGPSNFDSEEEWIIEAQNEPELMGRAHEELKKDQEDGIHHIDRATEAKIIDKLNKLKAKVSETKMKQSEATKEQCLALVAEFKEVKKFVESACSSKTKSKTQTASNNQPTPAENDHRINAASAKPNQSSSSSTELQEHVKQEKPQHNSGDNQQRKISEKDLKRLDIIETRVQSTIDDFRNRMQQIVNDTCCLCPESNAHKRYVQANSKVVSSSELVYMVVLPYSIALTKQSTILVPRRHVPSLLHCNDEEWQDLRKYMKSLVQFWVHEQGYSGVLFYENAAYSNQTWMHANMNVVPVEWKMDWANARIYLREHFEKKGKGQDSNSVHQKLIITSEDEDSNYKPFRKSIAKETPYFHIWFDNGRDEKDNEKEKDEGGGYGHIIDEEELEKNKWRVEKASGGLDVTGRKIVGGVMERVSPFDTSKRPRWDYYFYNNEKGEYEEKESRYVKWTYQKQWDRFDWTKQSSN